MYHADIELYAKQWVQLMSRCTMRVLDLSIEQAIKDHETIDRLKDYYTALLRAQTGDLSVNVTPVFDGQLSLVLQSLRVLSLTRIHLTPLVTNLISLCTRGDGVLLYNNTRVVVHVNLDTASLYQLAVFDVMQLPTQLADSNILPIVQCTPMPDPDSSPAQEDTKDDTGYIYFETASCLTAQQQRVFDAQEVNKQRRCQEIRRCLHDG